MKVTIATGLYPPEIGGPATHTVLLESKMPQFGHEISVVPFRVSREYPKGIRHLHYFWQVYRAAKGHDIIFAQDVLSVAWPAYLASRLRRVKFVVRVPGDYAWEQSAQRFGVTDDIDMFQTKRYGFKIELLRFLQKAVVRRADAVVTPSRYFERLVVGWGIKPQNIKTIYNGVNLDIKPAGVQPVAHLQIVSAGRLVPWKGFDLLIKIMETLPAWQLVILGDGPDKDRLQSLAKEHGVQSRVHFLGSVSREEVFGWCKASTVFVLNSRFESFSYQIVEAMASGAPVVTTAVGSLPELITDGQEGRLLMSDDKDAFTKAILSTLNDKAAWGMRTRAAKEKAQVFSVEKTCASFDQLFRTLCNEKPYGN